MDQSLTLKVRLYPTTDQAAQMTAVCQEYQRACNLVSKYMFSHYLFEGSHPQKRLNDDLYQRIRDTSFLNSQMVQSTFKTVIARYRTVKAQMKQRPFKFYDQTTKKLMIYDRDLAWLQKPILFRRPQADFVRKSNYSFLNDPKTKQKRTIISLTGQLRRLKMPYDLKCQKWLFKDDLKLGTAKLVKSSGHWFLHISYTKTYDELAYSDVKNVVGLDRGDRFLITAYDSKDQTNFKSGKELLSKRRHYKWL